MVRVLIVDDQEAFTFALEAILALDDQVQVVGRAHDGRRGVDMALKLRPDVVLMDISMPVMDGFTAAAELHRRLPEARVVMLSGSRAQVDRDRARYSSAVDFIWKGDLADQVLDSVLQRKRRDSNPKSREALPR